MKVEFNAKDFIRKVTNLTEYAEGFITGLQDGDQELTVAVGERATEIAYSYLDDMARMHPESLGHVYEWGHIGNPAGRLFSIMPVPLTKNLISLRTSLLTSKVPVPSSGHIFVNKAFVMETGNPVTIAPKKKFLVFDVGDETVFTTKPLTVQHPGGAAAQGGFEQAFKNFETYFENTYLQSTWISSKIKALSKLFNPGSSGGSKAAGKSDARRLLAAIKDIL